jgi:hypothetical protein
MEEKFKCPRCGFEQSPTEDCRNCRVNIPKYIELQKRRRAVPSGEAQRPQRSSPPDGTQEPPADKSQPPKEEAEPPKPPEISPHKVEGFQAERELPGIGELFDRSWKIFKSRIGTLIALYLLSGVFFIVPFGIFIGIGYLFSMFFSGSKMALIVSGGLVGMIAGIIAASWGYAAFIFAVADESLGIKDSLDKGWQRVGAFIWLLSILGFIIMGGFLLFLIPGVIFTVWFAFAQFIIAGEDEKGMNALLKSKEYVKEHWFDVFLRLLIVWLISGAIGMVPIIGPILSILFMPFMMIFIYLIYEDLRSVKGDVAYSSSKGEKFKWIGIGTLGYVVVPLIVIAIMGASIITSLVFLKGMLE